MTPSTMHMYAIPLLTQPWLTRVQDEGFELLLSQVAEVGFQVERRIGSLTQGNARHLGAMLTDPVGGQPFLLRSKMLFRLGDSTTSVAAAAPQGSFIHEWAAMLGVKVRAQLPDGVSPKFVQMELRQADICAQELARLTGVGVLEEHFRQAFEAPSFPATPRDAHKFARQLTDALAA